MSGVGGDDRREAGGLAPVGRDEQAADWCLRLAEDGLTPEEQRAFDAWLEAPEHRAAFEDALLVWQGAEGAAEKPEAILLRSHALESFRDANHRRWRARHRRRGWQWSLMAALSLAVITGALWQLLRVPVRVYETGTGERRVAVLDDGSRLSLDAASRVEVRMGRERRELRLLAGRAKFDVAKDALRPFSVAVGDKLVVATGTAFSVEMLRRRMHVVLYEGHVEVLERPVRDEARPLRLPPGQALTPGHELVAAVNGPAALRSAGKATVVPPVIVPIPADPVRTLSWEAGQLNFVNEPLSLAVERVNRYSREMLVIRDPDVGELPINGVFTAGDIRAFIEGVTRLLPVQVNHEDGRIALSRRIR